MVDESFSPKRAAGEVVLCVAQFEASTKRGQLQRDKL